jgi:carboxylesterase
VEVMEMLKGMIDGGTEVMDGIGSDIAEPGIIETAYPGTPLAALYSFQLDGLTPLAKRYSSIKMPLLLFSSVEDHVVSPTDGDVLMAEYGGPSERVMLERSYHVATQDFDKEIIFEGAVAFAQRVTA